MSNLTHIIRVNNPLSPTSDRQILALSPGMSIREYVDDHPEIESVPTICIYNSEPVLRADWDSIILKENDLTVFVRLPAGDGSRNWLGIIISSFLIIAGTTFLLSGIPGAQAAGAFLVSAGVGGLALNSGLLEPPRPPSTDELGSPSPTYSFGGRGNRARLLEAIPVTYGRHQMFPDLIEQPYVEYIDNVQYLHQIFCIGPGEHSCDTPRIEDSLASEFDDISVWFSNPTVANSLAGVPSWFKNNVITSVEVVNQEITRDLENLSMPAIEVGWFTLNPGDTTVTQIAMDVACPRGIYHTEGGTIFGHTVTVKFEARRVINLTLGRFGATQVLGTENITGNSYDPIYRTFKYAWSSPGQVQIRAVRVSAKLNNYETADTIHWTGAKAYLSDSFDYSGLNLVAARMKASEQLTVNSSRQFNCVVQHAISHWHPTNGWVKVNAPPKIQNPVWAVCDLLRNTEYGVGLKDAQIDLQGLYDLSLVLEGRGDEFNGIFDRQMTAWEALRHICRVARCVPILQGGIFRMVRDTLQTIPTAMFSMRNIVAESFSISYRMASEDTVDGVEVEYVDETDWTTKFISRTAEGGTPLRPARVRLFGCTNQPQAMREALYIARNNKYRRRTITLTTELEGYIPTFGDLVVISHDMPDWGISGEVQSVSSFSRSGGITGVVLHLTEPLTFTSGSKHYIALRDRAGKLVNNKTYEVRQQGSLVDRVELVDVAGSGSWTYVETGTGGAVVSNDNESIQLDMGEQRERTHFAFGKGDEWSQRGVIKSIRPRGEFQVELTILAENDLVHTGT